MSVRMSQTWTQSSPSISMILLCMMSLVEDQKIDLFHFDVGVKQA
jgi:hypothetical protein